MQFIADSDQSMQKKCCLATYQPKMNVRGKRNEEKKKKKIFKRIILNIKFVTSLKN